MLGSCQCNRKIGKGFVNGGQKKRDIPLILEELNRDEGKEKFIDNLWVGLKPGAIRIMLFAKGEKEVEEQIRERELCRAEVSQVHFNILIEMSFKNQNRDLKYRIG